VLSFFNAPYPDNAGQLLAQQMGRTLPCNKKYYFSGQAYASVRVDKAAYNHSIGAYQVRTTCRERATERQRDRETERQGKLPDESENLWAANRFNGQPVARAGRSSFA
jgi:hypothetical protein